MASKNILLTTLLILLLSSTVVAPASAQEEQCDFRKKEVSCSENSDCLKDTCASSYCSFPVGSCGEDEAEGVCKTKPEMCTMQYQPVCACDGKTYSNDCAAAAAGVSIRSSGACLN